MKLRSSAFTLIELLVVISIIALLSSVVLSSLNSARSKARDARRIADMKQMQTALELYRSDNGGYITAWVHTSTGGLWKGGGFEAGMKPYIQIPIDPGDNNVNRYMFYSSGATSMTCGGVNFNTYEYVLAFNLENPTTFGLPVMNGSPLTRCLPGPAK